MFEMRLKSVECVLVNSSSTCLCPGTGAERGQTGGEEGSWDCGFDGGGGTEQLFKASRVHLDER